MNYLTNDRNLVRDAELSATNIVPSQVYYRTDEVEKLGGGTATLSGDFTGDADTVIEVEVLDDAGTSRNVSQPTFTGTGNGVMSAVTAGLGVDPQEFVVSLVDLGTETRSAQTPFQGAVIVARTPGAGGNAIKINIDPSGVVGALSDAYRYSLQAPLQAGVNEYTGVHLWNWNTPYLNADGTVPTESPRIRFGDDPQVYRPYKRRVGRDDVFSFSPAPVRDVPIGTALKLVTGTYSITVTDGITPETLPGITTLYDALTALSGADLVMVQGAVVNDQQPGGQGVNDLSVRTTPYVASIAREGTSFVEAADIGLAASSAAPSETLRIVCTDVSLAGAEKWSVDGDVSEGLPVATTQVPYVGGPYSFEIPLPVAAEAGVKGTISARFVRPDIGEGDVLPNFEAFLPTLGIGAVNGTYVFEWMRRPIYCNEEGEVIGLPNPDCLGLVPINEEGELTMSDASRRRRMERLHNFLHTFIKTNTRVPPVGGETEAFYSAAAAGLGDQEPSGLLLQTTTAQSPVAEQDIAFVNRAGNILATALRLLGGADANLDLPEWEADTAYPADTVIHAAGLDGVLYRFAANNNGGTSDALEPAPWPTTFGGTINDGTVTWENIGKSAMLMWDDLLLLLQSDADLLQGNPDGNSPDSDTHTVSTAYDVGDVVAAHVPDMGLYLYMRAIVGGTSGGVAPAAWPTTYLDTIVDGTVTWEVVGLNSNRNEGDSIVNAPVDAAANANLIRRTFTIPDAYYDRYQSGANRVLIAAGIDPDFELTGGLSGDGCRSDIPEALEYFGCVTPGADYAPMFPNVYYHSSKLQNVEGEDVYLSTKEFGLGPKIGCVQNLRIRDQIVITVSNVNGVSTYQQGDEIVVSVVRAEPVALNGGQTGDDTLTWSVVGSVDGALSEYLMATPPGTYSDSDVEFDISRGAIPYVLGDEFRFAVQAARGQWRQDGGAWSAPFAIGAPQALVDGLSAVFAEGASPSWVPADRWTFAVKAVNGVDNIRSPTDARTTWATSTLIEVTPVDADPITGVFIGDHTIPADATITLTGSDDGFATTPLTLVIPWRSGNIWQAVVASYADYRLSVSTAGSINWLALIDPLQVEIRGGIVEIGRLTKRIRLPGAARRAGLGVTVEHEAVTQESMDAFVAAISAACTTDQRRIGIVPNEGYPESAIVTVDADTLEVSDVLDFQPRDEQHRLLAFSVELSPIP